MKRPWTLYASELVGTALLIAVGVSFVILDFGEGTPVARILPDPGLRRLITGFFFGATGALVAVSPIGRISGAHINPVVTLAFLLRGKLRTSHAFGYVLAQLAGGVMGALPLLAWGTTGRSVSFGATFPGDAFGAGAAVLGEMATTFALVFGLLLFLGHRRLRAYTPLLFPLLYAVMVYVEAPVSGTSTNPARSLGPALIAMDWRGWWVYWIGPGLGALAGVAAHRVGWLRSLEVEVAKLYHFEHDPGGFFRRAAGKR